MLDHAHARCQARIEAGAMYAQPEGDLALLQPRILLVEDDAAVRSLVSRMLRGQGYEVVEAANGVEALQVAASGPPFQLVITDVVMPTMNGPEMVRRLEAMSVVCPVLYITGFADTLLDHISPDQILHKPFLPRVLVETVRRLLTPG